jgi:hypothetical protein
MRRLPTWRVAISAHTIADRWEIPDQALEVHALSDGEARELAAERVHVAVGVAPWRPWRRQTYARTSATLIPREPRAERQRA